VDNTASERESEQEREKKQKRKEMKGERGLAALL
jgi:hypothetical protein